MKKLYVIYLGIFLVISVFTTSCLTSFVSNTGDINKASRDLSRNEKKASATKIVPQSNTTVNKTIRDYLYSKNNESVVRYKYSKILKQYHNNEWEFLLFPPKNKKSAWVSSKKNFFEPNLFQKHLSLIMVYVEPTSEGTEIKVAVSKPRDDVNATEVLNDIINSLPAPKNNSAPDSSGSSSSASASNPSFDDVVERATDAFDSVAGGNSNTADSSVTDALNN